MWSYLATHPIGNGMKFIRMKQTGQSDASLAEETKESQESLQYAVVASGEYMII